MRPVARLQSALRTPLNAILGAEANVRILRVLSQTSAPMSPSDLASGAMVNLSGALRALSALEELGIIERVGTGRRQPVVLRREHPLASALKALFSVERERLERLRDRLKGIVGELWPPPKSAWIEGAVATGQDRLGATVTLGVLAMSGDVDRNVAEIETASLPIQRDHDVTIDVRGLTEADLVALSPKQIEELQHVLPVFGPPPGFFLGGWERKPIHRTHADIEQDARTMAAAVARQLKRDPGIVERAKKYIQERLRTASAGEQRELRAWDDLLSNTSPARLRHFLVDPGARATRLRQTMPFLAVLSPDEQAAIRLDAALARRGSTKKKS